MNLSDIISAVALVVAVASLALSAFTLLQDRACLVTKSQHFPHREGYPARMSVSVVNAGRRPVILRMWGSHDADGHWAGTLLGKDAKGLRLAENERHEFVLLKEDLLQVTPDEDVELCDIWFEDTVGRRYVVKEAKKNIVRLRA
jgi:hypothetical protein